MSIYLGTEKVSQATGATSSTDTDLSNYYDKNDIDKMINTVKSKIIQSDLAQEDNTKIDFIKNKPDIISSSILTNLEIDQLLQ